MMKPLILLLTALLSLSTAHAEDIVVNGEAAPEIDWETLMPEDYVLSLEAMYNNPELDMLDDYSDKAQRMYDELMQSLASAPVVEAMHGRMVSIPGFVVPLEGEGEQVDRFFLVPYFGACIHVPPPPSNQIVHVRSRQGIALADLYQPFWITGTMQVEAIESELANAGYRIEQAEVEAYSF